MHTSGTLIDTYAQKGNPKAFSFTKPKVGDLEFSFSGLKTGILYFVQRNVKENPNFIEERLYDICASIQHTIVEILMDKIKNAVKKTGIKHIAIAGGVSANSEIRRRLQLTEKTQRMDYLYSKIPIHNRQCGDDRYHGVFEIPQKEFFRDFN